MVAEVLWIMRWEACGIQKRVKMSESTGFARQQEKEEEDANVCREGINDETGIGINRLRIRLMSASRSKQDTQSHIP